MFCDRSSTRNSYFGFQRAAKRQELVQNSVFRRQQMYNLKLLSNEYPRKSQRKYVLELKENEHSPLSSWASFTPPAYPAFDFPSSVDLLNRNDFGIFTDVINSNKPS